MLYLRRDSPLNRTSYLSFGAMGLSLLAACGEPELGGRYSGSDGKWISVAPEGVCAYSVGPFSSACTYAYESGVLTLSSPYGDRFSCLLEWVGKEGFELSECENATYDGTYERADQGG